MHRTLRMMMTKTYSKEKNKAYKPKKAEPSSLGMESLQRAKNRACYLLGASDYSAHQIKEKLLKNGYTTEVCEAVVAWLSEYGYIDDNRFAHSYVRSHRGNQGVSKIKMELKRKGLSEADIYEAIGEELDSEQELDSAISLLERRHIDLSGDAKEYAKHYRYLCSRGYSISVVSEALEHFKHGAMAECY